MLFSAFCPLPHPLTTKKSFSLAVYPCEFWGFCCFLFLLSLPDCSMGTSIFFIYLCKVMLFPLLESTNLDVQTYQRSNKVVVMMKNKTSKKAKRKKKLLYHYYSFNKYMLSAYYTRHCSEHCLSLSRICIASLHCQDCYLISFSWNITFAALGQDFG